MIGAVILTGPALYVGWLATALVRSKSASALIKVAAFVGAFVAVQFGIPRLPAFLGWLSVSSSNNRVR
jgi:sulfite exporter TauE/SafE